MCVILVKIYNVIKKFLSVTCVVDIFTFVLHIHLYFDGFLSGLNSMKYL